MISYITGSTSLIKFNDVITPSIGHLIVALELAETKLLFLDLETTGKHPRYDIPLLMGLMLSENEYYVIDLVTIPKEVIKKVLSIIEKLDFTIVAHNASFDLSLIYYHYKILFNNVWCTQVVDQVLFNGVSSFKFSYAQLVLRYHRKYLDKSAVESFIGRDTSKPFNLTELVYLANDLKYLGGIRNKQLIDITKKKLMPVIELEMRFLPKKVKMESYGIAMDREAWMVLAKENQALKNSVEAVMRRELIRMDKEYKFTETLDMFKKNAQMDLFQPDVKNVQEININLINFNSPKQLINVLNSCEGNFQSTRLEAIQQKLRDNSNAPYAKFLELLIQYRGLEKAVSTYGEGFLSRMDRVTGKIHTNFTQAFTTTGRLSSSSYEVTSKVTEGVNLQNIKAEPRYRKCFIADENRELVTADYGGQEISLAAWQSQDPLLLAAVRDGLDIHSYMAQESFRIVLNDPTFMVSKTINSQYRKMHKNVLFALFYGASSARIADTLDISIDIADRIYQRIRELLHKFMEYQDKIKSDILTKYSVHDHSYTNRVRYFEKLFDGKMSLHKAEKEASNFPIQSSGASMIKLAICELDDAFIKDDLDSKILFTVHDEIIVDIPKGSGLQKEVISIMKLAATKFLGNLPVEVEAVTLPYWTK